MNGNTKENFPIGSWVVDWRQERIGMVSGYVDISSPWDMRIYVEWRGPKIPKDCDYSYAADLRAASLLEIIAVEADNRE